jgi:lysophospholipase L1-like esterase
MTLFHNQGKARNAADKKLGFKNRRIFELIVVVVSTFVSLIVAEGLVRLLAPQSLILLRPDIFIPTEQLAWRHAPDVDTRVNTGEREARWRTDDQGMRIGGEPPKPHQMTLVALGDSLLEAMQVEYEETMTAILEKRLSSRLGKELRILNTGTGGWDPNQYRIQLEKILETRRINGVVVFVYLGNDIIDKRASNYPPRQPIVRHALKLPKSFEWNELIIAVAYPINDFLEIRSHLFILVKARLKYTLMKMGLTAYYFPLTLLRDLAQSNMWEITSDLLQEIAIMGKHHDLKTLFVLLPSPSEANPEEGVETANAFGISSDEIDLDQAHMVLGEQLRRRNLSVVDMTPALRAAIKERIPDVYGRVDNHLGKAGHQVIAHTLEEIMWQMFCAATSDSQASHITQN